MTRDQFTPDEGEEAYRRLTRRIRRELILAGPEPNHTPQCDEAQVIREWGSGRVVRSLTQWCCEWHEAQSENAD